MRTNLIVIPNGTEQFRFDLCQSIDKIVFDNHTWYDNRPHPVLQVLQEQHLQLLMVMVTMIPIHYHSQRHHYYHWGCRPYFSHSKNSNSKKNTIICGEGKVFIYVAS